MLTIDNEFKNLIPPLTDEEYAGLEASILAEGCRDALIVWGNTLIDGHNRYEICTRHGLPYRTVQKDFADRDDVKIWMMQNQLARRNLNDAQRILIVSKCAGAVEAKAKERMSPGINQYTDRSKEIFPATLKGQTRDELGALAGVSGKTYEHAMKVFNGTDESLKSAMLAGDLSINQAYQTVRREEKKQEVKQRIDEYATVQTGVIDIHNANKKYNIIYADPPWQYWESGNKNQSLHYTTMTIDDICDLPVKDIADDDCVLFLWVTYPILQEAFRVIEAWGFKYSTAAFVWVKKNKLKDSPFFGNGAWTRANSELCLLATKGNIMRLDASISQVVESPIEEHSRKPDIVRELITRLVGELPRVELFCRNPAEGWDVWGNEA